jgi:hypothetical protein
MYVLFLCMYVCTHVYMYVCTYVRVYVFLYVHAYMCVYLYYVCTFPLKQYQAVCSTGIVDQIALRHVCFHPLVFTS